MSDALRAQLELLPDYLGRHLLLVVVALALGVGMSLPLAFAAVGRARLRAPLLGAASVVQTIPALALLALMVPLLGGRIGYVPALCALVLYSALPVLRNAITGLVEVDAALVEAGRGLGMTDAQILRRVRLPLALPVIVAGVRTATVWVVGIGTLSTPVGATSLGNYIFSGLQTQNHTAVLVGCVSVALLALVLDGIVRGVELALRRRRRAGVVGMLALLAAFVLAGLAPLVVERSRGDDRPVAHIGTKTFTEQYVLGELLARRLEAAGFRAASLDSLGSTVVFDALVAGEIDVYVDYSGTIWANHMERDDNPGAATVLAEVTAWLADEHGVRCLGALGFENAYAFAMRRSDAEARGVTDLRELARISDQLDCGGDYEFFQRPEWAAVRDAYGLRFADRRSLDSTLMYGAVADGSVDVISAFSTDGRIAAFDLAVLADPLDALPPYDAVLLLSPRAATDAALVAALEPLVDAIDVDAMRRANMRVDHDGGTVAAAAAELDRALRGE